MSRLNTRLIVSAEDRGASKLLNRLGAESQATVKQFSNLGAAFTTLIGGISVGYGTKKALSWVDDYRMDILSIATTLSDTWKDTGKSMEQVFAQNKIHAESFFKLLRIQARRSIASFEELKSAYTIFASKGMALDVNIDQAKTFADLVDRITLATRGQNKAIQVQQELRAILEGRARPSDVLAKIFLDRDAAFIQNMKRMVAERDTAGIVAYMGELMADVPLDRELSNLLSKQLSNVRNEVAFWAKDAFAPLYDVLIDIAADAAAEIGRGDSPLFKGLEVVVKDVAALAQKSKEVFQSFSSSEMGRFLVEAAPRFIATSAAVLLAAKAFSTLALSLKAAAIASTGGLGAVAVAAGAVAAGGVWSQRQMTREQAEKTDDSWEKTKVFLADMIDGFTAWIKGAVTGFFETVKRTITNHIAGIKNTFIDLAIGWEALKGNFFYFLDKIAGGISVTLNTLLKTFDRLYYEFLKTANFVFLLGVPWARKKRMEELDKQRKESQEQYKPMFVDFRATLQKKTVESDKKIEKLERKKSPFNILSYIFGDWIGWSIGGDLAVKDWMEKQAARRDAHFEKNAAEKEVDGAAMTGLPGKNIALIEAEIQASSKRIEQMAKAGANLESVLAQLESSMLKGGNEFEYALSQVNKEYMQHKAKIVRFAGEQENALEALIVEQQDVQRMMAKTSGVERDILLSKNEMLNIAKQYATQEQAILKEKDLQAELEKKIAELALDEAKERNAISQQVADSKVREQELLKESEKILKDLNEARGKVAMATAEHARDLARVLSSTQEADRLEGKVLSLMSFQAGLPGKGGAKSYAAQSMIEAANIQKQIAEIGREFDIAGARETEAQALERINTLQRQYLDLYRETAFEADSQVERLENIARLAETSNIAGGFLAALHDIEMGASDTFENIKNLTTDIFSSMQSTMSSVFFDFFSGKLDSAKDYFAAFGQSILQAFSDMLAKMLVKYITTSETMKHLGGWLSSIFGAGSVVGASASASMAGLNALSAAPPMQAPLVYANGGIAPGGFHAFATGGIVNKPTLGLIGEGHYNEAVVPLPDGRSIPVTMNSRTASAGTNVTVNLIDNSGQQIEKSVHRETDEQGNLIVDIVLDAVARNKRGARAQFKSILGVS